MDQITLRRPDDWHLHLRDGHMLQAVLPYTTRQFARAIVMPNLVPPVTTVEAAAAYRQRILNARPVGSDFEPLMTLYLTDNTQPETIRAAAASGFVHGVKLYPAGATTNSDLGVTNLSHCQAAIATMAEVGLPLLVHGEVTRAEIDIFDREARFIDEVLAPLLEAEPRLRVVFEHITTARAAQFVVRQRPLSAATLTPQHLLFNRNRAVHWRPAPALLLPAGAEEGAATARRWWRQPPQAARSSFSAPTARRTQRHEGGQRLRCAGCFTAPMAHGALRRGLRGRRCAAPPGGFASFHGPDFYGLAPNVGQITLVRQPQAVPLHIDLGNQGSLVPLRAGETLAWSLVSS
jgi:dihydroorotase